jgi:hypothetical protein
MKNRSIYIIICAFTMALSVACTKDTTVDAAPQAVVEAYLIAGQPIEVHIHEESVTGTVDTLQPINGLSVYIVNNGITYTLNNPGNGTYNLSSLTSKVSETYELKFIYKNKEVSAITEIPPKPVSFTGSATTITMPTPPTSGTIPTRPDPVIYKWANSSNAYHLLVVKCVEANPVEIDLGGAVQVGGGGRIFRTQPTQASIENLMPNMFSYYGLHEVLLYRILPEYAALYEDNGSNSNNLTSPPGNITNGLGIFTGVNIADKLYITVN